MTLEKNKPGRPITMAAPWGELFRFIGQKEIADKLGVSKSTVGKWATDVHRVPELARRELLKLCEAHGIKNGIKKFENA
jgi:hypothetical protein